MKVLPNKRMLTRAAFFCFLFLTAGSGGSADKFVRVVGSGRGSASRTPTRRAAVTTHTSLDASQAMNPWEAGSQLPDTDPDSGAAHVVFFVPPA